MRWATTTKTIKESLQSGEIQLVLSDIESIGQEYLSSIAHTKRFLERWTADPVFRNEIKGDAKAISMKYGLQANPEEIRLLWDAEFLKSFDRSTTAVPLAVKRYESFIQEKLKYRDVIRGLKLDNPKFESWRRRNIYRTYSELGVMKAHGIVHAPIVFELSQGCSVGCWFCGVSAQRLKTVLEYNDENKALWREVLTSVRNTLGVDSGKGFCYWASDPLDNPGYLSFLKDYSEILENIPQTTTAIPMKNVDLIRDILAFSQDNDGELNRFSILTIKQLNKVHEEFSAEELLLVELVTQNKGAITAKAVAGRARDPKHKKKIQEMYGKDGPVLSSTISCVSGFLVNMVEKTIRLISPCNASDKWPLGYMIFDERKFSDAVDFDTVLNQMISMNMKTTLDINGVIRLREDLEFLEIETGFMFFNKVVEHKYENNEFMQAIGDYLEKGETEVFNLVSDIHKAKGYEMSEIIFHLNILFKEGVLDNEPKWKPSPGVDNGYKEEIASLIVDK